FSREQIYDLLSQPDPKLFVGLRDLAIVVLMLDTGIRVRELCDIKVDDIRWEDNQILIRGKSGEDRLVPIGAETKQLLTKYVRARGYSVVDWLFITVDAKKMSRDSVSGRTEKYGRRAGLKTLDAVRTLSDIRSRNMLFKTAQTFLNCKKFSGIKRSKCRGHTSIYLVRIFCGRIAGLVRSITLICVFNQKKIKSEGQCSQH